MPFIRILPKSNGRRQTMLPTSYRMRQLESNPTFAVVFVLAIHPELASGTYTSIIAYPNLDAGCTTLPIVTRPYSMPCII